MTNPNNIVRVRARNGGRASVYEANGWAQIFSTGLFEGNGVTQNTSADMNVLVGGSNTKPDVLIAQNPAGYKIALDVVGQQAVAITAPASNSRISAIVAYTDDLSLSTDENTVTGSPASCGLIVVNGDAAASPVAPDDTAIRAAITADGATGSQASYVVIATIRVASSTTTITNSLITGNVAQLTSHNIDFATFEDSTEEKIVGKTVSGDTIYERTVVGTYNAVANTRSTVNLPGFTTGTVAEIVDASGYIYAMTTSSTTNRIPANSAWYDNAKNVLAYNQIAVFGNIPSVLVYNGGAQNGLSYYLKLRYTKN